MRSVYGGCTIWIDAGGTPTVPTLLLYQYKFTADDLIPGFLLHS